MLAQAPLWRPDRLPQWSIALCIVLLGFVHTLVNPYLQSPDEMAHADLVTHLEEGNGWPVTGGLAVSDAYLTARSQLDWSKDAYERRSEEAPPRQERPPLDTSLDDGEDESQNAAIQHPPLYYVTVATLWGGAQPLVFTAFRASADRELAGLRLINVAMLALAAFLTVAAVRRLGGGRGAQLLSGAVMLALPQLVYIGSSVNNDNGLVLAFAGVLYLGARVAEGETSILLGTALGLVAGAASLSKSVGILALGWAPLFFALAWSRGERELRRLVPAALATSLAAAAVGLAWWIRNLLVLGVLQPRAHGARKLDPIAGYDHGILDWARGYVPRVVRSLVGNFGYLDAPVPSWMTWLVAGALVALVCVSVVVLWRRDPKSRVALAVLLLPVLAIPAALGLYNYVVIWDDLGGRFAAAQGRYYFAAVPPLAAMVGLAVGDRWRRQAAWALTAAAVVQIVGLLTLLDTFWAGETLLARIDAVIAWSPWPPRITIGLPLLLLAVPMVLGVRNFSRRRRGVRTKVP